MEGTSEQQHVVTAVGRGFEAVTGHAVRNITLGLCAMCGVVAFGAQLAFGANALQMWACLVMGAFMIVGAFGTPIAVLIWIGSLIRDAIRPVRGAPLLVASDENKSTSSAILVKFNGEQKLAISIASFVPAAREFDGWLERWPVMFGAPIIALQSTGGPKTHGATSADALHKIILIDCTTFDTTLSKATELLAEMGIRTAPFDPALLEVSGSHDWWASHYLDRRIDLSVESEVTFVELQTVPNHTAIMCVDEDEDELRVSLDIFLYFRHDEPAPGQPLISHQGVQLVRDYKLRFAAALTEPPVRKWNRFRRVAPRKIGCRR